MTLLVTGGAGFIGSAFVREWLSVGDELVVTLDRLTYAGNPENLAALAGDRRHVLVEGDIRDGALVRTLLEQHRPSAVVHLAAESHVDRSITGPAEFISTNVNGTFEILRATLDYWSRLSGRERDLFRVLHVSTDEVYGSIGADEPPASEVSPYRPSNPYSASKAASDHLAEAYARTYGLPVIITNCTNNFGPFQYPEKLIPVAIMAGASDRPIPVYAQGDNIRDWLHVSDHCAALRVILERGRVGERYNIAAGNEVRNIDLVRQICALLDELDQRGSSLHHDRLIRFVDDRPGHDFRYSLSAEKLRTELGWSPKTVFSDGLRDTVQWYLSHRGWVERSLGRTPKP